MIKQANNIISDTVMEDGTRVIVKADGTIVTIKDGKTTIEYTGEKKAEKDRIATEEAAREEARAKRALPPAKTMPPDFSHLAVKERPLNVGSWDPELSAREMSNFEHSPFVLDGRRFESVEGFYIWLKFSGDATKQALAQKMYSYEAKKFGSSATNTEAEYEGETITLGGPEHHALLKRAIAAKLAQHPDLARRFADTHAREIIHDMGRPESASRFPAKDFTRILTELRQELVDGTLETIAGPVSELQRQAHEKIEKTRTYTVSELLELKRSSKECKKHSIDLYIEAFRDFPKRIIDVLAGGDTSLVLEMPDNEVLVITKRHLPGEFNPRQNVLHVIESGEVMNAAGVRAYWYTQPKADTSSITREHMKGFQEELDRQGYSMPSSRLDKLGIYNGGVKLLDAFVLKKMSL